MNTKDHTVINEAGIDTVQADEAVPGLLVYRIPEHVSPGSRFRWTLGVTVGLAMASFESREAASQAAHDIAGLTDWTASPEEIRAAILPFADRRELWWNLIRSNGGLHPSDAAELKEPRPITAEDIRSVADRYEGDDTDGLAIISGMAMSEPFASLSTDAFNEAFDQVMRLVHPEHYTT